MNQEDRGRLVRRKNLDTADDQRRFPHGSGSVVDLGTVLIGDAALFIDPRALLLLKTEWGQEVNSRSSAHTRASRP